MHTYPRKAVDVQKIALITIRFLLGGKWKIIYDFELAKRGFFFLKEI